MSTWVGGVAAANKTWTVGDSEGWSAMDYTDWLKGKVFAVGDELLFPYSQGAQDVAEVSEADYEACNGKNAINHWIDGNTRVSLQSAGSKYYICTFPGHCPPLKLAITVAPTAAAGNATAGPGHEGSSANVNNVASAASRSTPTSNQPSMRNAAPSPRASSRWPQFSPVVFLLFWALL